jgi:hypothetical protein
MISCISVWLEEWAPDFVAFLNALEWAVRLRVPLHAVRVAGGNGNGDLSRFEWPAKKEETWPLLRLPDLTGGCTPETLPEICRLNHVELTIVDEMGTHSDGGLNVIGAFLPEALRAGLLQRGTEGRSASLLCASEWSPLERPMLVNNALVGCNPQFLHRASEICGLLRATPVVLTIAPTESDARRNQTLAKGIMAEEGLIAQFDYAAYCDLYAVIEMEANCRRCRHVFAPSELASPRRRLMRNGRALPSLDRSGSLSFLLLGTENACGETNSASEADWEAGFPNS